MLPHNQVDVNAGVDPEVGDLLHNAGWAVDVNHSLVDAHLVPVPCLGTLSARTLSRRYSENLCGNADWSLGLVLLVLGSQDDFCACGLKGLDFLASECHPKHKLSRERGYLIR